MASRKHARLMWRINGSRRLEKMINAARAHGPTPRCVADHNTITILTDPYMEPIEDVAQQIFERACSSLDGHYREAFIR